MSWPKKFDIILLICSLYIKNSHEYVIEMFFEYFQKVYKVMKACITLFHYTKTWFILLHSKAYKVK
jgi:hypothetical protein